MTVDEEMDGWSYDDVLKELSFPFLRYRYKDGSRATLSAIVGVDGARMEDGHERGKDYESYTVIPGRYEHLMRCFMKTEHKGAQRLWHLAIQTMRMHFELHSVEDEQDYLSKRWELGMLETGDFILECLFLRDFFPDDVYPAHKLEEVMLLTMCWKPWDPDSQGDEICPTEYEDLAVDKIKQLHPQAAESIELFRVQIKMALPGFRLNTPAALGCVQGLVDGKAAEKFDMPKLELG